MKRTKESLAAQTARWQAGLPWEDWPVLVFCLDYPHPFVRYGALAVLEKAAATSGDKIAVAGVHGCLPALVSLMRGETEPSVLCGVAEVLISIAGDKCLVAAIAQTPGCLPALVSLLGTQVRCSSDPGEWRGMPQQYASVLKALAADADTASAIVAQPGCLPRLVAMLGDSGEGIYSVQKAAAELLHALACHDRVAVAVAREPGCRLALHLLLNSPVQEAAAAALSALARAG
jgi:hypothetical protein